MTVHLLCSRCAGLGYVPLPTHLEECLRAVSLGWPEVRDIARYVNATVTATNNRVVSLWRHGFLTRRKNGKAYVYSLTASGSAAVKT